MKKHPSRWQPLWGDHTWTDGHRTHWCLQRRERGTSTPIVQNCKHKKPTLMTNSNVNNVESMLTFHKGHFNNQIVQLPNTKLTHGFL